MTIAVQPLKTHGNFGITFLLESKMGIFEITFLLNCFKQPERKIKVDLDILFRLNV